MRTSRIEWPSAAVLVLLSCYRWLLVQLSNTVVVPAAAESVVMFTVLSASRVRSRIAAAFLSTVSQQAFFTATSVCCLALAILTVPQRSLPRT